MNNEITVIRADILGYCMGVRRAVELAKEALEIYPHKQVFTLGPLIHNKSALEQLANQGLLQLSITDIDSINSENPPVVIIRAHGVPPVIKKALTEKNCIIIDATCPRVLLSQKRAADFAEKHYEVLIAGDKNHGEVTGIAGFAEEKGSKCQVVENVVDAENISSADKAILISQTTISRQEYEDIAAVLKTKIADLQVFNTICPATSERQKALEELCSKVEGILVIGGKNSANTQRLFMNAEKWCKGIVAHIETTDEIPTSFFHLKTVGLTAGASTPDEIIDEVEYSLIKKPLNKL
jgi:4-hydroxy-3-methylbut-2-enyl diphosphate reductase